jgi:hypothetical protein
MLEQTSIDEAYLDCAKKLLTGRDSNTTITIE